MFIDIDRSSSVSIKKQLYDSLTYKILNCELNFGEKLPSSRELANYLQISRNTVVEVYEQLIAELYITTRKGSGTFISNKKKCNFAKPLALHTVYAPEKTNRLSLVAGAPDLYHFPKHAWQQATRRVLNKSGTEIYGYGDPNGYLPLRQALQKYLNTHKGIKCCPENIIITGGTKDAVRLIAMSFKGRYKNLITESPSVKFVPKIFRSLCYNISPIKVDRIGMVTTDLYTEDKSIIYTSAAHQFPFGGTLTIERRHQLIDFAVKHDHFIIEDDCDSEFRYRGAPVNSLYQICSDYVMHIGTFSKTICPSLRLGYLVLPAKFSEITDKYTETLGNPPGTIVQAIVNDLIRTGDYEKHIYKMTKIYKAKNKAITDGLNREFAGKIRINGEHSGLHIAVEFIGYRLKMSDKEIFTQHNLEVQFSNEFATGKTGPASNRLILNFAHLSHPEIAQAIRQLKKIYKILTA